MHNSKYKQSMSLHNPSTIKHGALRQLRQMLPAGGVGRHINGYILTAHPDAVAACKGRLLTELKQIFQSASERTVLVLKVLRLRRFLRYFERWFAAATTLPRPKMQVFFFGVAKEDRRFVVKATPDVHRVSFLPLSNKQTQLKPKRRQKFYRCNQKLNRRNHQGYRHRHNAQPRMLRW